MSADGSEKINDELKDLDALETNLSFLKIPRPPVRKKKNPREEVLQNIRTDVHRAFLETADMCTDYTDEIAREQTRQNLKHLIDRININQSYSLHQFEKDILEKEMADEIFGMGPLEDLLRSDNITEIMVNGPGNIYIEKNGKIILTDIEFRDEAQLRNIIQKIVSPLGRRIDESSPIVDARLPDGSRVNAVIPPLALDGSLLTIRKFQKEPLQMFDLIRFNALSEEMAVFLRACVEARINIIVSGGTGSGKTTLLNILSSFIGEDERIVTAEDAAELQIHRHHRHVGRLESRPPNAEGKGCVTIRDLIRNALRMRPDRIIVGEVRGEEALDMLQAMNTGHDGSMTTAHANSPVDLVGRIETMVLYSGINLPVQAIRKQICSSVDCIVQSNRMRDGRRVITEISEVHHQDSTGNIVLKPLFWFKVDVSNLDGEIHGTFEKAKTGPSFIKKIREAGVQLPRNFFPE